MSSCVDCRSKAASNTIFAGLKTELDQLGRTNVSITVAVLGLIGTDENMNRGDALASRSMPVPDCAAGIICAVDSRTAVAYVPKTLSMFSTLIHHMPFLAPSLIKSNYIGKALAARLPV